MDAITSLLSKVDGALTSVVAIIALLQQIIPKTVKLYDILSSLFKGRLSRLAVTGIVVPFILYLVIEYTPLRIVFLSLTTIGILFLVILLAGPARKTLYPEPRNPKRAARFKIPRIIVGGKNFLEQHILCEILAIMIKDCIPSAKVDRLSNQSGTYEVYHKLQQGEIDLYVEYTGTALAYLLKLPLTEARKIKFGDLNELFRDKYLVWLEPLGFNNTYCIVMRRQQAEELGVQTISQLAKVSADLKFKGTKEFDERPDGLAGLSEKYNLYFKQTRIVKEENRYRALCKDEAGFVEADVTSGFATDAELYIEEDTFIRLQDDREFFPSYLATPLVHQDLLDRFSDIKPCLEKLDSEIDEREMAGLIHEGMKEGFDRKKDLTGLRPLATRFLKKKNLI